MTIKEVRRQISAESLAVATKQAMRYELGQTFSTIANLTGVHGQNVTSQVYAKRGSNVRAWENRTPEQQQRAIELAKALLAAEG